MPLFQINLNVATILLTAIALFPIPIEINLSLFALAASFTMGLRADFIKLFKEKSINIL